MRLTHHRTLRDGHDRDDIALGDRRGADLCQGVSCSAAKNRLHRKTAAKRDIGANAGGRHGKRYRVTIIDSDILWPRGRLLPRFGKRVTVRYGTAFLVADELAKQGTPTKGRQATEAATRLVMTRIAELLPPRQRGVYAADLDGSAQELSDDSRGRGSGNHPTRV